MFTDWQSKRADCNVCLLHPLFTLTSSLSPSPSRTSINVCFENARYIWCSVQIWQYFSTVPPPTIIFNPWQNAGRMPAFSFLSLSPLPLSKLGAHGPNILHCTQKAGRIFECSPCRRSSLHKIIQHHLWVKVQCSLLLNVLVYDTQHG